jgi:hypothetical protein
LSAITEIPLGPSPLGLPLSRLPDQIETATVTIADTVVAEIETGFRSSSAMAEIDEIETETVTVTIETTEIDADTTTATTDAAMTDTAIETMTAITVIATAIAIATATDFSQDLSTKSPDA